MDNSSGQNGPEKSVQEWQIRKNNLVIKQN
jgi:hypothetical protein